MIEESKFWRTKYSILLHLNPFSGFLHKMTEPAQQIGFPKKTCTYQDKRRCTLTMYQPSPTKTQEPLVLASSGRTFLKVEHETSKIQTFGEQEYGLQRIAMTKDTMISFLLATG